ncbi:arginase [Tropicimonas sp. IMCC34043]|uniref:arginase n=1 Tax=Tropicimonas sp. IMCC34043 TaxID=2248760 RepID=UPI000E21EC37|nr:arginase [Tropicimonas sp. IMCC34043]
MTYPNSTCILGAPVDTGAGISGCAEGPGAWRAAGLIGELQQNGRAVVDLGDARPQPGPALSHANPALRNLSETAAMIRGLGAAARQAGRRCALPVFLGGDHSISAATVPAMAARAAEVGRPFFVLWLDAHPDLHDLHSTVSGNLHGTPAAYSLGLPGFEAFSPLPARVNPANLCMMGLRSVDGAEARRLAALGIDAHPMADLHRTGVTAPLAAFLDRVAREGGDLHVSFDVDFLDPAIAPGTGTTEAGGATEAQAGQIAAMLRDSGLVSSLDLVELNPRLDDRACTATLMCRLAAGLLPPGEALRHTGS